MDEHLPLSDFAPLIGPESHYSLHHALHAHTRYQFVRERLLSARDRLILILIVRDPAAGRDYRLIYHPVDVQQSVWRLSDAARCDAEDAEVPLPALVS